MNNPVVDVTNCDREPIHIPGFIQNHGFLIAIDKRYGVIRYVSENINEQTGLEAAQVLGASFEWFLEKSQIVLQSSSLSQLLPFDLNTNFDAINPVLVEIKNVPHYLIIHGSEEHILLAEFEPCEPSLETDLNRIVGVSLSRILESKTVKDILQNAARQIREIIRYDRVMVYQFHDDGHGEVVAEDKADTLEPFMGLHYPASDIPKQAKDLYLVNLTRSIVNVHSDTSALLAESSSIKEPLDLTHSVLRAVSPIHIQYLKNMKVAASFSVSLVSDNKLWGLVACHNSSPKFIDYKAREAAKLVGQILSSSITYRESEESKDAVRLHSQSADEFARHLQKEENLTEAFEKGISLALQTTLATGIAVVFEGRVTVAGNTPSEEEIREIIQWLQHNISSPVFQTESFSDQYEPALSFSGVASGVLACMLSKEMGEYIIWFKPEKLTTVNWAGNPNKPVETDANGQTTLSPRHSFAAWSQEVKNTSESWSKAEVSAVLRLREDLMYAINQKINKVRQLNEKLKEAYDELDTFSFTVSHDLKTPLTSIRSYTQLILQIAPNLDENTVHMLNRILKSTDKMQLLIKEVLSYSRISREKLQHEEVNMELLLNEVVGELQMVYKDNMVKIEIINPINIKADKMMMMQVFTNIISNAVKYYSHSQPPVVTIEGSQNDNGILYKIEDNGIGIDMAYGNQIFDMFKRLDNAAHYEGSGVGLSIVKRIMEKHSAKIWYESELDKGTIFYLLFLNE